MTSGPKCEILIVNDKQIFQNEDDIRGEVVITTPSEGYTVHHEGIRISLIGIIGIVHGCLNTSYRK